MDALLELNRLPHLHVAVGVIINDKREILITQRASHKHEGSLWEFPGGKCEQAETVEMALKRELHEELGIIIQDAVPLLKTLHHYSDRCVLLDVWKVQHFTGTPIPRENQPMQWVAHTALPQFAFPAGNQPIIAAVQAMLS
jgi:8-oxo-dGTP diphosphatase